MNKSIPQDKSNLTEIARGIYDHLLYLQCAGVYGLSNHFINPQKIITGLGSHSGEALMEGATHEPGASLKPEQRLLETMKKVKECTRCKLHLHRTQIVFGTGNLNPEIVFVGDGPGEEEDRTGTPFVGAAGQLLSRIINAMGLTRDQVYLCNILKCKLPRGQAPGMDEFRACRPFLEAQIQILKPKIIVALGEFSASCLTNQTDLIQQLRTQSSSFCGIPMRTTYHPADLLTNTELKRLVWNDVKMVLRLIGKPVPGEQRIKE